MIAAFWLLGGGTVIGGNPSSPPCNVSNSAAGWGNTGGICRHCRQAREQKHSVVHAPQRSWGGGLCCQGRGGGRKCDLAGGFYTDRSQFGGVGSSRRYGSPGTGTAAGAGGRGPKEAQEAIDHKVTMANMDMRMPQEDTVHPMCSGRGFAIAARHFLSARILPTMEGPQFAAFETEYLRPKYEEMEASRRRLRSSAFMVALVSVLAMAAFMFVGRESAPSEDWYATVLKQVQGMRNPRYKCHTTEGDFVIELFLDTMPLTASNFMDLAETGFYNGIHFHRIIDNFMIQFGCPYARHHRHPWAGTGGPPASTTFKVANSYSVTRDEQGCIPDEFQSYISNVAGTLAMANKGDPNSGIPCQPQAPPHPVPLWGCLPQPRWAVCATGAGAHQGQLSREGGKDIWWTAEAARGGTGHLGLTHTEPQRGRLWTACGQRRVDNKNSQTTPATTSTSSIRQPLGAADAQTAHHATFSTAPTHQILGSANAETTPAGAPAAAADRTQRPDATCKGKNR